MSFSDHKITQFTHRISELADQPNMPADELKARFDSSPEELRESVNGICDDAARLEARVEGIVVETFGDTIDKSMLSTELAAELDAKAEAADLTAETTAREGADASLNNRVITLETEMPQKVEIYIGTYNGTGSGNQRITLPFTPKAVLVSPNGNSKARVILPGYKAQEDDTGYTGHLEGNVLVVYGSLNISNYYPHYYIAFV